MSSLLRVWDVPPSKLCRNHLLGEHREVHAIWSVLTLGKKGYSRHPETLRWKGRLGALYSRHQRLVRELKRRGYRHNSTLDRSLAKGSKIQSVFLESRESQISKLKAKNCGCFSV